MSLCSYDYCIIKVGSADPVEITNWGMLVEAMRQCGDRVWRIRRFDGDVFYKLRSFKYGGSVVLSTDDARRLVKEYGIKFEARYVDKNGDGRSDYEYIDPAF